MLLFEIIYVWQQPIQFKCYYVIWIVMALSCMLLVKLGWGSINWPELLLINFWYQPIPSQPFFGHPLWFHNFLHWPFWTRPHLFTVRLFLYTLWTVFTINIHSVCAHAASLVTTIFCVVTCAYHLGDWCTVFVYCNSSSS